jgi:hypothetical protein
MTVLENLQMGAYLHGGGDPEDYERVYTLFPLVRERRSQLAGTLSGGEQQMVAMGGRSWLARSSCSWTSRRWARAHPRRAQLRDHQAGARRGRRDAHRGAERERLALDRRSRLRALDGSCRARGKASELLQHEDLAQGISGTVSVGDAIRCEFPIFEHTTYANSCSQGALSNRVRAAAEEWLEGWDANGASGTSGSSGTRRPERPSPARPRRPGRRRRDDVGVAGVSALVSALDLSGERNRIVISEYEFPTVGQIAHAQELRGAEVVHVRPEADGRIPLDRFAEAIDERTALVCCTGRLVPVGDIGTT